MSGEWRGKDEGDSRGGVLGVLGQAGGKLLDACTPQQANGGIPWDGHHGRPLSAVQGASVLPQRDILDPVQPALSGFGAQGSGARSAGAIPGELPPSVRKEDRDGLPALRRAGVLRVDEVAGARPSHLPLPRL